MAFPTGVEVLDILLGVFLAPVVFGCLIFGVLAQVFR